MTQEEKFIYDVIKMDPYSLKKVERISRFLGVSFAVAAFIIFKKHDMSFDIPQDLCVAGAISCSSISLLSHLYSKYTLKNHDETYIKILSHFCEIPNKMNLKNPDELFALFLYSYTNGYLSSNKSFNVNHKVGYRIPLGSAVIEGNGDCKHIASLFSDFINQMNDNKVKASIVQGYITYGNEVPCEDISKGNHIITLVDYDGEIYAYDPTNYIMYEKYDSRISSLTTKECKFRLVDGDIFNSDETKRMIQMIEGNKFHNKTTIDHKEIVKTMQAVKYSVYLLEKFYEDNKDSYEEIYKWNKSDGKQRNRD